MLGCLQQMSGFSGCSLKERGNLRTSEILGALYLLSECHGLWHSLKDVSQCLWLKHQASSEACAVWSVCVLMAAVNQGDLLHSQLEAIF